LLINPAQEHQEHLGQLVTHVDNTSVAEALVRLLGADDQTATFMPPAELAWLQQTDVLQVRLTRLRWGHARAYRQGMGVRMSLLTTGRQPSCRLPSWRGCIKLTCCKCVFGWKLLDNGMLD